MSRWSTTMSFPELPQEPLPQQPSRRKRVVAREVDADSAPEAAVTPAQIIQVTSEIAAEMHSAASSEPVPVVDPTTLGRRHRRSSHQSAYRWTQFFTLLGAGLATASVVCTMVDEPLTGKILAGVGVLAGLIATSVSGRTSLSERWRGWAISAAVFAGAALLLTWVHSAIISQESGDPSPRSMRQGR